MYCERSTQAVGEVVETEVDVATEGRRGRGLGAVIYAKPSVSSRAPAVCPSGSDGVPPCSDGQTGAGRWSRDRPIVEFA